MINFTNNEIIGSIIFLLPGFVAVYIACKYAVYDTKQLNNHEYYLFSLLISTISYALTYVSFYSNFNEIENRAISYHMILHLYLTAIAIGIILGPILKYTLHKNLEPSVDSVWADSLKQLNKEEAQYAHIFTSDNREFMGCIRRFSRDINDYREILIEKPTIIIRDVKYNCIDEIPMGEEMLFTEKDIKRILFIKSTCNAN